MHHGLQCVMKHLVTTAFGSGAYAHRQRPQPHRRWCAGVLFTSGGEWDRDLTGQVKTRLLLLTPGGGGGRGALYYGLPSQNRQVNCPEKKPGRDSGARVGGGVRGRSHRGSRPGARRSGSRCTPAPAPRCPPCRSSRQALRFCQIPAQGPPHVQAFV